MTPPIVIQEHKNFEEFFQRVVKRLKIGFGITITGIVMVGIFYFLWR